MTLPYRTVLAIATLTASVGCASFRNESAAESDVRQTVRLLNDPAKRDAAACELLRRGKYRVEQGYKSVGQGYKEEPCERVRGAVNHVIVAPQESGQQMYVVFRHWEFDVDGIGPGKARGPFMLLDSDGYIVPVFSNANYLDEDSDVFPYAGDSRIAIANLILHGSGKAETEWTAQVLHIVPVTLKQQSVLSVLVGPPTYGFDDRCAGHYWGWRIRDADGDGLSEVEIGPRQNASGDILPRAVYRWSQESGAYEGPDGSVEAGFMRIDGQSADRSCCAQFKVIERFALGRLRLTSPGDPSAVRTSKCDSFTIPPAQ
jgi:hypothetical protein